MNAPGFTAEASLYKTRGCYSVAAGWTDAAHGRVVPAQWCGPCHVLAGSACPGHCMQWCSTASSSFPILPRCCPPEQCGQPPSDEPCCKKVCCKASCG